MIAFRLNSQLISFAVCTWLLVSKYSFCGDGQWRWWRAYSKFNCDIEQQPCSAFRLSISLSLSHCPFRCCRYTRKECNTLSGWFHLTHNIILYSNNNTLFYFDMIDILFHLFPCSCVIPPNIHIDFHSFKLLCFECSIHNIYLFRSWWQLCQTCASARQWQ